MEMRERERERERQFVSVCVRESERCEKKGGEREREGLTVSLSDDKTFTFGSLLMD